MHQMASTSRRLEWVLALSHFLRSAKTATAMLHRTVLDHENEEAEGNCCIAALISPEA